MRREVRLAGSGGQGLQLAGVILAEAVALDGFYVAQTQSYGPESRGGKSRADIVIDTEPIDYPELIGIDALLALTQQAYDANIGLLRPGGVLVIDSDHVEADQEAIRVPVYSITEGLGREIVANMVGLGALNEAARLASWDSLEKAIWQYAPDGTADLNLQALKAGKDAV